MLRAHPFPFKAAVAICSDLDETPNAKTYFHMSDFLNTDSQTSFGKGVDLEVGNTIYFYMPADQFNYCDASEDEKARSVEKVSISKKISFA